MRYAQQLDIPLAATLAIGDGANDLMMLSAAGLGIGYRPKPLLQESLDNLILHSDLTAPLYAMGFDENEIKYS
jgi:phosphoserine phosphatase